MPFPEEVLIVGAGVWTSQQADQYPLSRWLMLPVYFVYHFLRTPVPTGDPEELPPLVKQVAKSMDSTEVRVLKKPEPAPNNEHPTNNTPGPPPHDDHGARVEGMESK